MISRMSATSAAPDRSSAASTLAGSMMLAAFVSGVNGMTAHRRGSVSRFRPMRSPGRQGQGFLVAAKIACQVFGPAIPVGCGTLPQVSGRSAWNALTLAWVTGP